MEKENINEEKKKEELGIYNFYITLENLLEKINSQSEKQLENIGIIYNQKLVEVGNQLKANDLSFSKVPELTNTINNKMMNYIKEASSALNEYMQVMEEKNNYNKKNAFCRRKRRRMRRLDHTVP